MSDQRLTQSPEKTMQQVARLASRPVSAPSYQGGLHPLLHLQRSIGNHAMGRLIQAKRLTPQGTIHGIQRQLTIGAAGDQYEEEADHVADQVMRMPDPALAGSSIDPTPISVLSIQRKCQECEDEALQRKSDSRHTEPPTSGLDHAVTTLRQGGQPLDANTRAFFEPRFGTDFSAVRIHNDTNAAASARAVNALAYTVGHNVVFNSGQYTPQSDSGKRLLAHELTHTLQGGVGVVRRSAISDDIQTIWDATPTLVALLTRLSRADVQSAQHDADIDSKIATLLAGRVDDLWVAQRIRQGQIGTTAGARPVEAHFMQGTTNRRALVIAGVHGSERQGIEVAGMLLADLAANQPMFTAIVVPTLFPDNAVTGSREGLTPTNRNFPPANEDLATATAAGGGTAVDASANRRGARTRAILPENIMLLQLIERFSPERIISIHGTRHSGAGGVFYDPVRLTPADIARARMDAQAMAYMQVPVEQQCTFEGQKRLQQAEERNFFSAKAAMEHRDRAPALAAAAQIDTATRGITGRERRPMEREVETTVDPAELARRRAHPSVPGDVGASGNLDTGFWSGSVPGGISLGGYASQREISIFTVEPPINLGTSDYPTTRDSEVDAAERRVELQAYADAVRTVLLGT